MTNIAKEDFDFEFLKRQNKTICLDSGNFSFRFRELKITVILAQKESIKKEREILID